MWSRRGGFTIIEVLVAIVITSVVAGVLYGSYLGSLRIIHGSHKGIEQLNMARHILGRISADLGSAFLRGYREYLVFVGVDGGDEEFGADTVTCIVAGHARSERDAAESELCEVSYFLEQGPEDEIYVVRREDPTLDQDPFSGGEMQVVGEGVRSLDFEYYDGESWMGSWDSREGNVLPLATRITVTLRSEEKGEETGEEEVKYAEFSTVVTMPAGGSWEEEDEDEEEEIS